ncbi:MAG: outer membrane lipoprotein carrier protein LolA [Rhizobiales bacterium]|nr:outer membrane lipoprotein carrier protein LolA [Hyphomicrobiales bacterium]
MTKGQATILGVMIAGSIVTTASLAQTVPVPVPAPLPKTGVISQTPAATGSVAQVAPSTSNVTTIASPAAPAPIGRPPASIGKPGEAKTTTAFDPNQRALADRVSNYLSSIRTLVGEFVQVGPDGSRTEGQLYLQKPGRVRFEYNPPSPIELIADGQSVVVRDRKLATQDLYPLSQTPLRFLLADQVDLLKDTNVTAVYSDDVFATVVIEEKQTIGGTHRLMLMFAANDLTLRQWTVTDPQGFDTTVAIYNLDNTKKPDPGLFKINYERVLQ